MLVEGLTELYLERERDDLNLLKKRVPMAALEHSDPDTALEIAAELAFMKESISKGGSVNQGEVARNVERSMVAVMNKGTEGMYDEITKLRRDLQRERRGRLRALMRLALGAFSHGFLHHAGETGEINTSMAAVADHTLITENQNLAYASQQQRIEIIDLTTALRDLKAEMEGNSTVGKVASMQQDIDEYKAKCDVLNARVSQMMLAAAGMEETKQKEADKPMDGAADVPGFEGLLSSLSSLTLIGFEGLLTLSSLSSLTLIGFEGLPGYHEHGAFRLPNECIASYSRVSLKVCDASLREYKRNRETSLRSWEQVYL